MRKLLLMALILTTGLMVGNVIENIKKVKKVKSTH